MSEEYLTVSELSARIKFAEQSIYNLIYKKKFIRGKHYLKPSRKKILIVWSEVEKWLYNECPTEYNNQHELGVKDKIVIANKKNNSSKKIIDI